jgi:molybdopterin-guanine dinucleotide biosynthesis protein B
VNVAAIGGPSGAGKTTLVVALIERYLAEGKRVGAIKHTHHPLNEENRGDTARFRAAGAEPVVLAGAREAVVFADTATWRVSYGKPCDLLALFSSDVVLVEGFRDFEVRARVTIDANARPTVDAVAAILDRIWHST